MNTAAVIVAAGLPKYDSVPAAMFKVGTVTSAQHVIASIQKAGVSNLYLAVDETTKKLEKQLNSSGAFFIRTAGRFAVQQFSEILPGHSFCFQLRIMDAQTVIGTGAGTVLLQRHLRSEERRVGKECRSRWSPYH